jgi:hypothetical protein
MGNHRKTKHTANQYGEREQNPGVSWVSLIESQMVPSAVN